MSLETRLSALATRFGTAVKGLAARVTTLEGKPTALDIEDSVPGLLFSGVLWSFPVGRTRTYTFGSAALGTAPSAGNTVRVSFQLNAVEQAYVTFAAGATAGVASGFPLTVTAGQTFRAVVSGSPSLGNAADLGYALLVS